MICIRPAEHPCHPRHCQCWHRGILISQSNIAAKGEKGAEMMDSSCVCTSYGFALLTKPSIEITYKYRGHHIDAQFSCSALPQVMHTTDLGFLGVELQNLTQSDWNQVNPSLQRGCGHPAACLKCVQLL